MEAKFKKNKAMIESKQKLLTILNTTHLFQRSYCINICISVRFLILNTL